MKEEKWIPVLWYVTICGMIFTRSLLFLYLTLDIYLVISLLNIFHQRINRDRKFMIQFAVMVVIGIYCNYRWLTSVLNHDSYVLYR